MLLLENQNTIQTLLARKEFKRYLRPKPRSRKPSRLYGLSAEDFVALREKIKATTKPSVFREIQLVMAFSGFDPTTVTAQNWTGPLFKYLKPCTIDDSIFKSTELRLSKQLAKEALALEYQLRCKLEFGTIDPKRIARKKRDC